MRHLPHATPALVRDRREGWILAVLGLASVSVVLWGAWARGGWLDEFATFHFADPSIPLRQAWFDLWPSETNPPFFYLIARWGVAWFGDSLFARRLVNLPALLAVLIWLAWSWRTKPLQRRFLTGWGLFAFSSKLFMFYFPEYRSYFWQFCAELVFVGQLVIGWREQNRSIDWWQLAMLPILVTMHQVTALYTAALVAVIMIADARRGAWSRVIALGAVAVLSALPLLAFVWLQHAHAVAVASLVSWIKRRGPVASLWRIINHMPPNFGDNYVALAAVAWVAVSPRLRAPSGDGVIRLIAIPAAIATLVLLAVNMKVPLIEDRYFTFLAVELAAIIVLALEDIVRRYGWLGSLILLNAAIYVIAAGVQLASDPRWNDGGAKVAALLEQCPQSRVMAGSFPVVPAEITGLNYEAQRYHFKISPPGHGEPGTCPILYWTEMRPASRKELPLFHGDRVRATNYAAKWHLSEAELERAYAVKTRMGIIIVVPPAHNP